MSMKKLLKSIRKEAVKMSAVVMCLAMMTTMNTGRIWASASSDRGNGTFSNPVIYADVPDDSIIRVGDTYYMASTTMHLSPGCPIMKSKDLVNWEVVNYVYDTLANTESTNLLNGKNMYGKGSWAASLKYNKGTYYVSFMSYTTGKTYIYQTKDIAKGTWSKFEINGGYHDMSLLFDDDNRVYMLYGATDIKYVELNSNVSGIKSGGASGTLFSGRNLVGNSLFEGTQVMKLNGYYYVFNISWPSGKPRTQYVSRSKSLNGPWESRIVLQDNFEYIGGVAQGSIIDTSDGKWYGLLFQDHGAVGRCPVLVPVNWIEGWPMMGTNGKVPKIMNKPMNTDEVKTIVKTDEFDGVGSEGTYSSGLGLVWQWNHNPDNNNWSLKERPGYLRLKAGSVTNTLTNARNTLTQRTYGPTCSGKVAIDVSHMKEGDVAGLAAFAYKYGYVGVKMENKSKKIIMVNASNNSIPQEVQSVNLTGNKVYFKIDFNFEGGNKAKFYYSIDGSKWNQLGNILNMEYGLEHFMGYRFGLFNYATQTSGGYVDFDYFRVSDELKGESTEPSDEVTILPNPNYATLKDGWYTIKNVNAQKYLQVKDNVGANGQNVEIGTSSGATGQKWQLVNKGEGYVTLKNGNGYMLDVAYGKDENGTNIQTYEANNTSAQLFKLLPTSQNDVYGIVLKCTTDTKGLDVFNKATTDGANVQEYTYYGATNQTWLFESCSAPGENTPETPTIPETPTTPETPQIGNMVKVQIVSDWTSGATANITVTNLTGKALNGWTCTFTLDRPITSLWSATLVSQVGNTYTIANPDWQPHLAAGESYTFGCNLGSGPAQVTVTGQTLK